MGIAERRNQVVKQVKQVRIEMPHFSSAMVADRNAAGIRA